MEVLIRRKLVSIFNKKLITEALVALSKLFKKLFLPAYKTTQFKMPDINELQDFATQVSRDILRQVHKVNSGHPGGSFGCTEFFTALYQGVMDQNTRF